MGLRNCTNPKIKILFVVPHLGTGGAQMICNYIAQNIDKSRFDPHLLVVGKSANSVFPFDKEITTFLEKSRVLFGLPQVFLFFLRTKPNIVFSILELNTFFGLIAPFFKRYKFIIRIASVVSVMSNYSQKKNAFYSFLNRLSIKNIDKIVCQSNDMAIDLKRIYNLKEVKVQTINNPITQIALFKESPNKSLPVRLVTIGRLSEEKGHLRILEALSEFKLNFIYTIIGSGPLEQRIIDYCTTQNLNEKVCFVSHSYNTSEELLKSDIFLQGSFVEGFPNSLLESIVSGVPAIAFDAPGGTKEIIVHGVNGYIVKCKEEFLEKLLDLWLLERNPQTIRETVLSKFDRGRIIHQYESLFLELVSN